MLQSNDIETTTIQGIPLLIVTPKNGLVSQLPTIFIYHGWYSNKENYQFVAKILASYGYQVIVPDLPLHGDRMEEKDLQADFWRVISQTVQEFDSLLQETKKVGVDPSKTVLFGSSTGGFISTGIFAQHSDLKGLISVNGSGAWEASERLFRKADGRPPASEDELQLIRAFDPIGYTEKIFPRPVLLQHGLADSIIPIEGQSLFYEELRKGYGDQSSLLTFQKIPRMDHYISLGMFETIIFWLNEVFHTK
jgi:uncharacterized protein